MPNVKAMLPQVMICYEIVTFIKKMCRKRLLLSVFLLLGWSMAARGQFASEWLGESASPVALSQANQRLNDFVGRLDESNHTARHLSRVFRKVHATFLKEYEAYTDFSALVTTGKYDCLTATALFSQVLSELKYAYTINQTNYHIFLLVETAEGTVLIETTDRLNGVLTDPKAIEARIENYRNAGPTITDGRKFHYRYQSELRQEVAAQELAGLMMFNRAVKAYNQQNWIVSARNLEAANFRYPTGRCEELGDLLVRTLVARKDISQDVRRACMEHLMSFVIREQIAANGID